MAGGAFTLSSASEVARDRTQAYNALRNISRRNSKNNGHLKNKDYHKLQMLHSQGDAFATTDSLMKSTAQFCSTSRKSSQLGIDMTYK